MQQHGSKYFARRPPSDQGVASKGQNSTFLEHGHVVYQIKCHECSNMVASILPADPPPNPCGGGDQKVKIHLFQNMVMLHIKLNGITNAVTW